MPKKPWKKKGGSKLSGASETHLLIGSCLLCNCGICSGGPGMSIPLGLKPYTLNKDSLATWERHKSRLLEVWQDPEGRGLGSGFTAEGLRGAGRLGLPCWAEITFDGAKLPKSDKSWPPDIKNAWRELKDNKTTKL
jgi:hypothetical protein